MYAYHLTANSKRGKVYAYVKVCAYKKVRIIESTVISKTQFQTAFVEIKERFYLHIIANTQLRVHPPPAVHTKIT